MKLKTKDTLSYFLIDVSFIIYNLFSPSYLIEAIKKGNAINKMKQANFNPINENNASKGLPHLCESAFFSDGVV
jgi:hypothetical protein